MPDMTEPSTGPILVADDEEETLELLRTILCHAGYSVRTASCAQGARQEIERNSFALILTDLRLPAASGLDLLNFAREKSPLTVGIIISGHGTVSSAIEALRDGAYDFLLKPCPSEVLLAAVRRALEHHALKSALVKKAEELAVLESQLKDSSRILQDVSHELKNPLSVVCGYAAMLMQRQADSCRAEDMNHSIRSIHLNAQRLNVLLNELSDAARLSSGKMHLAPEPLPVLRLLTEAADSYRLEASRCGIGLEVDAACGPELKVRADYGKVHQILSNLLSNALKFTPRDGSVRVSAEADDGFARFCVRDTGVGIPSHDLPRIFERFYQAKDFSKEKQGMGLGLEICRGLVQLQGGRIWVESRPGQGSAFYFTLPLAGDPVSA
ncbi:MAG TPA: hypothetical protein DEB40_09570 [Elusimicrobia bacterium]|nr:hypothetical protein [Elusimicrobiota bacterium]HBT61977.1 hypothetical protein [Elusimicrobiota bacterium]